MRNSFHTINSYDVFAELSFHFFFCLYLYRIHKPASQQENERNFEMGFLSFLFFSLNKKINFFLIFLFSKNLQDCNILIIAFVPFPFFCFIQKLSVHSHQKCGCVGGGELNIYVAQSGFSFIYVMFY